MRLLIILLLATTLCGQHTHELSGNEDEWDTIRVRPITVISYDDQVLQYEIVRKRSRELRSFTFGKDTKFKIGKKDKDALAYYCETHAYLYGIYPL